MAGFERNGEPFAAYFRRWDLTAHVMTLASGEVVGLAITGAEGRGKTFLYELHVAAAHRCRGYATALLELAERSSTSRSASATTIELNVHEANASARGFYERMGFVETGRASGGDVIVMRRRR
jgi:ribosomal protein S18 acetylase RimI-like enzyme